MKQILHLMVFLALVATIAGGALATANAITQPIIQANALAAEKENLQKIFPNVDDSAFEEVEVKQSQTIEKIFKVKGEGTIFKLKVSGYKEGTTFMVAFDNSGTIINYVVLSNGDTQGIGSKVGDEAFKNSLINKKGDGKLDTISGATISSRPVIEGIKEAATYFAENIK